MPRTWIARELAPDWTAGTGGLQLFPVWLLLGPRQVGKSALMMRCGPDRQRIDLDDLALRARVHANSALFARELRLPVIVDGIQYAPELLSPLKQLADRGAPPGSIWVTKSQNFAVMEGVRETLAGRVALAQLLGLSDAEKQLGPDVAPPRYFAHIAETGFPRLYGVEEGDARQLYVQSYVATYIERDVRELLRADRRRQFEVFVRMCALRTGQVVNLDGFAGEVGVSAATVKSWLSVLADSFLLALISPFHRNRSKRLIKSPKLYFLDMGVAAHLAGWRDSEALRLGPMGGAALETHVYGIIRRYYGNRLRTPAVHFWRTRDGQEIDFVVEVDGHVVPVEVKMGLPRAASLPRLTPLAEGNWTRGVVVSLAAPPERCALDDEWDLIHPCTLAQHGLLASGG